MPDFFYVIKHGRSFLSVLEDNTFVLDIEKARYFPNLDIAEEYLKLHPNNSFKIYEISITEA